MDTSNSAIADSIQYITKGRKEDPNTITPEGWLEIVQAALMFYKPYLKYFSYTEFLPMVLEVKTVSGFPYLGNVAPHNVFLGDGVTVSTRLMLMGPLFLRKHLSRPEVEEWQDNRLTERYLFLSQGGEWVTLKRLLSRETSRSDGYTSVNRVEVNSFHLSLIRDDAELLQAVSGQPFWGLMVLRELRSIANASIAKKQSHLDQIERSVRSAFEIESRIAA